METEFVLEIMNQSIKTTLILCAPMLGAALLVGILISLFQAVTQINEQTLSFVPKILVIFGIMILSSPWMINIMTSFTKELFLQIPHMVNQ